MNIQNKTTVGATLERLKKSKFRASFHLNQKDVDYINEKGFLTIQRHCEDFIANRLASAEIVNDGKQTPMSGHPVFKAQHACACCCRKCLYKWYGVPAECALTEQQQEMIVKLLMTWIKYEVDRLSVSN